MARQIVHTGRKIRVALDTTELPNGEVIRRDMIFHPGAVVILPVLDAERIVLLRNFRFVIDQTLWELPAGTLEPGEPIQHAAERELLEETGYTAGSWRYLGFLYASPGVLDEKLHLFVALDLTPGEAKPEADEQLEPQIVRFDDALAMALRGEILDAKTITGLLLWDRLRHQPATSAQPPSA
ncbi:NUDIX hydrolase [Tuwongella immobilis]|uniref:GDP-mannose pyrophosphatase n=1 Tax=Tuwongella immobilis TaxID=692036 RepID=A0A6C2YUI9_9BACT|nr:NUDIX hydrolase [Tuwongella immobilis]VIP04532.1 nudix hydrolase : NUDIX hydrolase OS=Thermotoga thermarum DSM 5069 GN=Theth_1970 PE=3 SV=1: NUDIX [Tuwongella immobilis]VTS06425.1 nudix hydrolase : NUDIX hydrolase OS=Thermotoga thermarum DSM 5069 GN=Theth_1970 PE=3 SV=1: NUDIX [Tuwongella immobilis]